MKTEFSINIGARIRHFRQLAGMSQLKFSELIDCDPTTLAHYETGKNLVSMTKLKIISETLNVEPYQFFIKETPQSDKSTLAAINSLLSTADAVQLGLIYNFIQSILELRPLAHDEQIYKSIN